MIGQRERKPNGKETKMSFKIRMIAAGLGASLLAAASIAAAQTNSKTTQAIDEQASATRIPAIDQITRMADQCNRTMAHMSK